MSQLKQVAASEGLRGVQLDYRQTNKNNPFFAFLERIGWKTERTVGDNNEETVMIPLERIADCPSYVEVYFELPYEKQRSSDSSQPFSGVDRAGKQTKVVLLTVSDSAQTIAKEDLLGNTECWDPEIH